MSDLNTARNSTDALVACARPFVKCPGGKRQLLHQYAAYYPRNIKMYVEPFLGGGAVYFDLRKKFPKFSAHLSDSDDELMNGYLVVRDHLSDLIPALEEHVRRHASLGKEHFLEVRGQRSAQLDPVPRAARLIYLSKTSFNGLRRRNRQGMDNAPMGAHPNPAICQTDLLRAASAGLRGARLAVSDFETAVEAATPGAFVYLDPPYVPVSRTANFTSYVGGGFDTGDQRRLSKVVRDLDVRGCLVMLSNSDTPLVDQLYQGFRVDRVRARRAINRNGHGRGEVHELVVRNY